MPHFVASSRDIPSLQAMIAAHAAPAPAGSVVGDIIRAFRPSRHVSLNPLFDPADPPRDFATPQDLARIAQAVAAAAPSVGRLEVQGEDGAWIASTTCFRVGAAGRLVATAGHAMETLLTPAARILGALPFRHRGPLRPARVNFDPLGRQDQPAALVPVAALRACHSAWDLLVCELGGAAPLPPPLALEDDAGWGADEGNPVLVLGHPALDLGAAHAAFPAAFGAAPLPGLHAAPGRLVRPPAGVAFPLPPWPRPDAALAACRHDATTLRGSSGAPVIGLLSGKVVGLHYRGGLFEADEGRETLDINLSVNIPVALAEPRLAELLVKGGTPAEVDAVPPTDWSPRIPAWKAEGLGPGTHESAWSATAAADGEVPAPFAGVVCDRPDFRDYFYQAGLATLPDTLDPAPDPARLIRDQGFSRACTGFALAAAVDRQLALQKRAGGPVSARMLYEAAKLHDEWIDRPGGGSSLRGAIKGFFQNGVCAEASAPWGAPGRWTLTRAIAKEARQVTLGAYFRLPPDLLAFQAALGEVGSVLVSAHIHAGWQRPTSRRIGRIPFRRGRVGAHAFVLVGYDPEGFVIQNAWGKDWGVWKDQPGLAHWSYEDWAENLLDAWVLRLAPGQPRSFDLRPKIAATVAATEAKAAPKAGTALPVPRRHSLIGHLVQSEAEGFVTAGPLGAGLAALRETALYLATDEARKKYRRLAFVVHDPFLGADAVARIAGTLVAPLKAKGVYPVHLLHALSEVETIRLRILSEALQATERYAADPAALSDFVVRRARLTTRRLWEQYRAGLDRAAAHGGPVWTAMATLLVEAGDGRAASFCAIGSGAILAAALARGNTAEALGAADLRSVHVAPTVTAADGRSRVWRLPPARPGADEIPGYRGDWPDLVAEAYLAPDSLPRRPAGAPLSRRIPDLPATRLVTAFEDEGWRAALVRAI